MRKGIIGLIVLLIGILIFALLFVLTQTKVIGQGTDAKKQVQDSQNSLDSIQKKMELDKKDY